MLSILGGVGLLTYYARVVEFGKDDRCRSKGEKHSKMVDCRRKDS